MKEFSVCKIDEALGLIFGWGIVCTEDGKPYYDLQGDHIDEAELTKAALTFMQRSRTAKTMHDGEPTGEVVFAFPFTGDVLKSFGIKSRTTGLLIGVKPSDQAIFEKYKDGTLLGFSIGGSANAERVEEVE